MGHWAEGCLTARCSTGVGELSASPEDQNFNSAGLSSHLFPPVGFSDSTPPKKNPPSGSPPSRGPPSGSPSSGDPGDPYNEFSPNLVLAAPNDQLNKHRMELPVVKLYPRFLELDECKSFPLEADL
eukprot:4895211-Amphidinium_carterae.1